MFFLVFDSEILRLRALNIQGTEGFHNGGGMEYLTGPPSKKCAEEVLRSTNDVQKMLDEERWVRCWLLVVGCWLLVVGGFFIFLPLDVISLSFVSLSFFLPSSSA